MISKVFDGHSFYHACRYICNKQGAEILAAEGVRGHDATFMAQDFMRQSELRPAKTKACFHAVLSFYPGERPGKALMKVVAKKYLEEIGIRETQYAIALHTDRAHLHLHIIANMVDNNGRSLSDSWLGLKGKKAAIKLTGEYHLIPADRKNLARTHLEAMGQSERNRYRIYAAIMDNLPGCLSLEDLEKRLMAKGISTEYKLRAGTMERQGISFKLGKDSFKGSKIDRQFSLGNLEKSLAHNNEKAAVQKLNAVPGKNKRLQNGLLTSTKPGSKNICPPDAGIGLATGQLLGSLLDPGQPEDNIPDYGKRKNRRKHL